LQLGVELAANLAVSVIGAFIVTLAGLVEPVNDPEPEPVQPLKLKLALGGADILTVWPLLKKPLMGLTVPPAPAFIVNMNWVAKFAV
jgi:hypothetical protein